MIEAKEVSISVKYECRMCGKEHTISVEPQDLKYYPLSSIYDDCDDGFELYTDHKCLECDTYNEIEIAKDKPFGCVCP